MAQTLTGQPEVLIAAVSGRALAASAKRAGLKVAVLDWYNDTDTAAIAAYSCAVASSKGGFNSERLFEEAGRFRSVPLIFGSGFEERIPLLTALAEGRELLGNEPALVRELKDPVWFSRLLTRLGIPHPETRLTPPPEPPGWLVKRVGGAGGVHVRRARADDKARAGWYFQRELSGRLLSAVFVADGRCAKIVGFSEQWPAQGLDEQPYLYGGAVTVGGFKPALAREIADIVYTLVEQSTLRGVCGIDFMVHAGVPYVLEVNPRPSATFELHEHGTSLVNWHIEACRRRMVQGTLKGGSGTCGHAIVYAQGQVQIPSSLTWPLWVSDRPRPGSVIGRATPVCTVHAKAPDPMMARRCLAARVAYMGHTLE